MDNALKAYPVYNRDKNISYYVYESEYVCFAIMLTSNHLLNQLKKLTESFARTYCGFVWQPYVCTEYVFEFENAQGQCK